MTEADHVLVPVPQPVGFLPVLRREIHVFAHSRFYLLFVFILPLISFGILGATFYQEIPRDLPIVVFDGDNSTLSREAIRMFDASSSLAVVAPVRDMTEGEDWIRQGKAYALVYLPSHLERDAKRGEAPVITVYYNNQWLLTSGVISRALRDVLGTLSSTLDVFTRMAKGENPSQALQRYEPIRLDQHPLFNPNLNYRYFLLPALLVTMIQVFVMMVTVRTLGTELRHGTAGEWLAVSGGRVSVALLGKLLPYSFCFIVLTVFMVVLLVRFFGLPMYGNSWVLFVASILFVLAYQSMGLAMVSLTANLRLANSFAAFYVGPAFAFAGITYPALGMPLPAKIWSWALPLSHYLNIIQQQALRGAPAQVSLLSLGFLALFVVIPPLLFASRMRRLMQDKKYWGLV